MHEATTPWPESVLDEGRRGCVRVRLHGCDAEGPTSFGVEVSAWNGWAGQFKLLAFTGGLAEQDARILFCAALDEVADFDWMTGEVVARAGNF